MSAKKERILQSRELIGMTKIEALYELAKLLEEELEGVCTVIGEDYEKDLAEHELKVLKKKAEKNGEEEKIN